MYKSTKTYGHNLGLAATFRQWRSESHCAQLHGYALEIKLTFGAHTLDQNGWVMDFGGLKPVKQWLEQQFDHTVLVAQDDPELALFKDLDDARMINMRMVPRTGCEAFAQQIFDYLERWLKANYDPSGRVYITEVEVREHGANSAIYSRS